jgi:hypothetical protein
MPEVGAAPLIFPVIVDSTEVNVAEIKELEDVAAADMDPDPEGESFVLVSSLFPELLSADCVGLLDCVFEASVTVDGVVGPSRLCM